MSKRHIDVTGNDLVDQATAEIAVALRDSGYQEANAYAEAERLRNEIMAGAQEIRKPMTAWAVQITDEQGQVVDTINVVMPHEEATATGALTRALTEAMASD